MERFHIGLIDIGDPLSISLCSPNMWTDIRLHEEPNFVTKIMTNYTFRAVSLFALQTIQYCHK